MLRKILLIGVIAIFLLSIVSIASAMEVTGYCVKCKENKEMNKAELVEAIASDAGVDKDEIKRALDAFIGTTTQSLKDGKRVALVGFGSFSISKRTIGAGQITEILKSVKFKAGDMPFLPNVEYTTTEDIAKEMVSMDLSGDIGKGHITEDQAMQFIDSFTNVILNTLQTGMIVNVGEDFGTFSVVLSNAKIHKGIHSAGGTTIYGIEKANTKIHETKNEKRFRIPPIGHVDHGKKTYRDGGTIQIPTKKVIRFKAGADLAKTVA